jgi:thiol-disulfide isomerase/thioredoxin
MTVRLQLVCILNLFLIHQSSYSQINNGPTEDSIAPMIVFKESVNKTVSLKNKFIVIDFWSTWCAPCIAGFPHFNALSNKYAENTNIVFVTMTDEDKSKVDLFFNRTKKELKGIRLFDNNGETMKAFNIESIPLSVVIDDHGIVKWKGTTGELKETILDSIIKKIPLVKRKEAIVPMKPYINPETKEFINKANFAIFLKKSTDSTKENNASGSWGNSGNDLTYVSYNRTPLFNFISFLVGKNKDARFIINNKQKGDFKIDVAYKLGKFTDSSYRSRYIPDRPNTNLLIHLLSNTFNFRFRMENKAIKGYRLIIIDTLALHEFETVHINPTGITHASESDVTDGIVEIVNHSMNDITISLEEYLKYPIKNVTGSNKHYDITLSIKNITEANKQLAKYGLTLQEALDEPFEVVYLDFY